MDIKYTKAQATVLNALAVAAKQVRDEVSNVKAMADNVEFQLDKRYHLTEGFGKNKLAEAIARYNTVADLAGAVCDDLSNQELEESFSVANQSGSLTTSRFRASN